jgi:hypothetical protein
VDLRAAETPDAQRVADKGCVEWGDGSDPQYQASALRK